MSEAVQQCKYCDAPIKFYRGQRGSWLPANPDGSPHRCKEYFAARKRGRTRRPADDPTFDVEFVDISDISLPNRQQWIRATAEQDPEQTVQLSLDDAISARSQRVTSGLWTALPDEHLRLLLWFHQHADTTVAYRDLESPGDQAIPAGYSLVTRAKGIYKPRWSDYALSVRQTLGSPYGDYKPAVRPDGTWTYVYQQEQPRNVADPAVFYTNRSLARNMQDGVPVGVLIQRTPKPDTTYLVLGLALVEGWEDGFFRLRGVPHVATALSQAVIHKAGHEVRAVAPTEHDDTHASLKSKTTDVPVSTKVSEATDQQPIHASAAKVPGGVMKSKDRIDEPKPHCARVIKNRQVIAVDRSGKRRSTEWARTETEGGEDVHDGSVIALPGPGESTEPTIGPHPAAETDKSPNNSSPEVIALPGPQPQPLHSVNKEAHREESGRAIAEQSAVFALPSMDAEEQAVSSTETTPVYHSVGQLAADSWADATLDAVQEFKRERPMRREKQVAQLKAAAREEAERRAAIRLLIWAVVAAIGVSLLVMLII